MARKDMAGLFSVNGSLTNLDGGERQLRLPTMSSFPQLARTNVRDRSGNIGVPAPVRAGAVLIDARAASLPEMTTDVMDLAASFAVENVKRDRVKSRPWSRVGLGQLVGRMLGQSQRAARP
jgi:hypothetical protein